MAKIKSRTSDNHKTKPDGVHKRAFEKVYWPYIPLILVISVLLSLSVQAGSFQQYIKHPGGRVLAYADSMTISGLLEDTNSARAANGLPALDLNDKLDAAAQANADDMAARDYWSHYTPDGNPPWIWVTNQGYSYQKLGQNLATGFSDEQSTLNGWMASAPHRENILDPAYKDVGFGYANVPDYTAAGGGPMTVVVAFYGEPQVLGASTSSSPVPTAPKTTVSTPAATPPAPTTATPAPAQTPQTNVQTVKKEPATTSSPKANITPSVKSSRLQLALGNTTLTSILTTLSIVGATGIGFIWIRKHARLAHRFLLKGERYLVKHPLTDLGLLIIACMLFILSQTAGLTQ